MNRRSSNDEEWQKVKDIVDKRDHKRCRFQFCISATEYYKMKAPEGKDVKNIDHAHIFSVGAEPSQCYNPKNLVCLSRGFHRRMDNYQNPLNGNPIDLNEHYYWWLRIATKKVIEYDSSKDYKSLLKEFILS